MKVYLGLDTSCYTTSVAVCSAAAGAPDGSFFQQRRLLTVPEGERGLMQSEAVFQHVTRLPGMLENLLAEFPDAEIVGVCASAKPRAVDDSYMPVFHAGAGAGRIIAASRRVPFVETTHQQGHLRAALVGTPLRTDIPCLAFHLSGGTTEMLRTEGTEAALMGGTRDLHAGQLIDRIGVKLGLPFPCGPHLEKLAREGHAQSRLTASIRGLDCHFSGAETQAIKWLESGELSPEDVAAEVFSCVARTVARAIVAGCEQEGLQDVLTFGGVASSSLIREEIVTRVAKRNHTLRLHFGRPELSGDNAVGVALIGMEYCTAMR